MIVIPLAIVCGTPMGHQTAVHVYHGNKKADHVDLDHVVETRTLDTINNVTLHAIVDQHTLVKRRVNKIPHIHLLNKPLYQPLVKHQTIVTPLAIAYGTLTDHQTVAPVSPGNKKAYHADQDHVAETQTPDTINNVTLHANVDHHLPVKRRANKIPHINLLNKTLVKPLMIVTILTIAYGTLTDHLTVAPVYPGNKKVDHADQDHVVETQTLDTINNAIHHANVDHHLPVKRRVNNIPHIQLQNRLCPQNKIYP
jgi:hypothetical protein